MSCASSASSRSSTTASSSLDRDNEPVLTQWDAWGNRVDRIEVSPLWREAQVIAARHGMVAAGYEPTYGAHARTHQFAIAHVLGPSLDVYSCPLAMTDGAARTLLDSGNRDAHRSLRAAADVAAIRREMWTSGQWMTERTGGSDVSRTETIAQARRRRVWRLYGTKWFTSATTGQMALTLARPEGNADGGRGLALFSSSCATTTARCDGIFVNRLKDKLGTRKVPTAELTLDGAPATLVGRPRAAFAQITPMLAITRTWNAVSVGVGDASRARARDATTRGAASRSARCSSTSRCTPTRSRCSRPSTPARSVSRSAAPQLLGAREHGGSEADELLARSLVPIAKLTTAKQAVAVTSRGDRGVRRRGLRRGHRAAADPRATRRCCRSGKARPTCCRSTRCARSARAARSRRSRVRSSVLRGCDRREPGGAARGGARGDAHASAWIAEAMTQAGSPRGRRAPVRADARPRVRARAALRARAVVPRSRPWAAGGRGGAAIRAQRCRSGRRRSARRHQAVSVVPWRSSRWTVAMSSRGSNE